MKESLLTLWLDEALEQQPEAACGETRRSRSERQAHGDLRRSADSHVLDPGPAGSSHPYPVEFDLPSWSVAARRSRPTAARNPSPPDSASEGVPGPIERQGPMEAAGRPHIFNVTRLRMVLAPVAMN
jgi:hypothetical protein